MSVALIGGESWRRGRPAPDRWSSTMGPFRSSPRCRGSWRVSMARSSPVSSA